MKKITKNFLLLILFFFGIGIVFASYNYFKIGKNSDANGINNDKFELQARLDIEDSRTSRYINNGYRGTINGIVDSELWGAFTINNPGFELYYKESNPDKSKCGGVDTLELYSISGSIRSTGGFWNNFNVDTDESYFCSNKYTYIKLIGNDIGEKEIGNGTTQTGFIDNFGKQEIYVKGIAKINGKTGSGILDRGDGKFNVLGVYNDAKIIAKANVDKNIEKLYQTFSEIDNVEILSQYKINQNKFLLYKLSGDESIDFSGSTYINKGEIIKIGNDGNDVLEVEGVHTIIVRGGNIYINSNITNLDSSGHDNGKNLLILVAKKDETKKKGGNIYIDPDITNIDAILIADGSLISYNEGNGIQSVLSTNQINNLRKQLLIYGSVFSSNKIGNDEIPYGADYYQNYPNNEMSGNIYDLGNLRTFNLNYGTGSLDDDKLYPIDGKGGYLEKAWAGQCKWFNKGSSDFNKNDCNDKLRISERNNPLIIKYNPNIQRLNPYILRK